PRAVVSPEVRGEPLRRPDDVPRRDGTVLGDRATREDLGDPSVLENGDPESFDRSGEAACELRGVEPRAVRVPQAADGAVDEDALRGLVSVEQLDVGVGPRRFVAVGGAQAGELGGGAGDSELPTLVDVGVDALRVRDTDHL